MKKLLLIFFCLPILGLGQIKKINNTNSSTEIEIGRLADRLGILGEMKLLKYNYHESKKVTYKVSFKNLKYMNLNQYSSFEFIETGEDFESLYNMILEGFDLPKGEVLYKHALNYKIYHEILIDIGNDRVVYLMYGKKGFAPITFKFLYKDEYGVESWSLWLNKKQISKLFGKK
jgi:hypothetical protein